MLYLIVLLAYLLFFFIAFAVKGLLFILFFGILFILPTYLVLRKFSLEEDERLVLAFVLGLGIFPSLVYYVGFVTGSLKVAALVIFVLFLGTGFLLGKIKKHS